MDSEQKVFVLASDANFFPSLKATIYDIKKLFGRRQKIVAYDLGGISNNKDMVGLVGNNNKINRNFFITSRWPSWTKCAIWSGAVSISHCCPRMCAI
jgi:hypothetical protein